MWPIARAFSTNSPQLVDGLQKNFVPLPGGPWSDSPDCAFVVPVTTAGTDTPSAILVAGVSPRRYPDDAYRTFLTSVADQIAATLMRVSAYESLAIRQIVDLIPVIIGVLKPDGTVQYANKAFLDYTGAPIEELMQPDPIMAFMRMTPSVCGNSAEKRCLPTNPS